MAINIITTNVIIMGINLLQKMQDTTQIKVV